MKRIALLILIAAMTHSAARADDGYESDLLGVWEGIGTAAKAIYGTLVVGKKRISWSGSPPWNPACKTTYTIVERGKSDRYPNMLGRPSPERTFATFKLKLGPTNCANKVGFLLFAFPSDRGGVYAEVVEFGEDNRVNGVMDFGKAE